MGASHSRQSVVPESGRYDRFATTVKNLEHELQLTNKVLGICNPALEREDFEDALQDRIDEILEELRGMRNSQGERRKTLRERLLDGELQMLDGVINQLALCSVEDVCMMLEEDRVRIGEELEEFITEMGREWARVQRGEGRY